MMDPNCNCHYCVISRLKTTLAARDARVAELEGEVAKAKGETKAEHDAFETEWEHAEKLTKELAEARREVEEKDRDIQLLGDSLNGLNDEIAALRERLRELEWRIYRPLKEGEITKEGDQCLLPDEDATWEPVNVSREVPSPLYPAHCQYRRPIVEEMKESVRIKHTLALVAERDRLRAENEALRERLRVLYEVRYEPDKMLLIIERWHSFMRRATAEAGIPHDEYNALINAASMEEGGEELDKIWKEFAHD